MSYGDFDWLRASSKIVLPSIHSVPNAVQYGTDTQGGARFLKMSIARFGNMQAIFHWQIFGDGAIYLQGRIEAPIAYRRLTMLS